MSKIIQLLAAAYVNGTFRSGGVFHVDDAEADRVIGEGVAADVTGDFTDEQKAEFPVEPSTTTPGETEAPETTAVVADEGGKPKKETGK